jgi:hypothetical protein
MEVDVAVEEPRAGIVCAEADRDIVSSQADVNHVALRRVVIVVGRLSGTANDIEGVAVQVKRMLEANATA